MKPYIFLTDNYLKYTQDENGDSVDFLSISEQTPFETTVYFVDRYGNGINRTIDTLILQGTNVAALTVEAKDIYGNFNTLFTLSNNAESTVLIKAQTPIVASAVKFTFPGTGNPPTITAKIGVYGFICNLLALTDTTYKIDANQGSYRVVSGSYIHWADYKKWVAKVKMENLTQEQFNLLTQQADLGEITVIPYEDLEADEIYECAVNREYQYGLDRKTELFNLELEFNEL